MKCTDAYQTNKGMNQEELHSLGLTVVSPDWHPTVTLLSWLEQAEDELEGDTYHQCTYAESARGWAWVQSSCQVPHLDFPAIYKNKLIDLNELNKIYNALFIVHSILHFTKWAEWKYEIHLLYFLNSITRPTVDGTFSFVLSVEPLSHFFFFKHCNLFFFASGGQVQS